MLSVPLGAPLAKIHVAMRRANWYGRYGLLPSYLPRLRASYLQHPNPQSKHRQENAPTNAELLLLLLLLLRLRSRLLPARMGSSGNLGALHRTAGCFRHPEKSLTLRFFLRRLNETPLGPLLTRNLFHDTVIE